MPRARLGLAVACLVVGCTSPPGPSPVIATPPVEYVREEGIAGSAQVDFSLRPADFFARPWPSELARDGEKLDFSSFPGKDATIIDGYVTAATTLVTGFSVAPVVYFHFNGIVDPKTIAVDPAAPPSPRAPLFLVDVDPKSPEHDAFIPIETRYYDKDLHYVPRGTLAVKPLPGFVLRPATLYAAVVRRNGRFGTPAAFEHVKWTRPRSDPAEEKARSLHAHAFDALSRLGVPRDDVAAIALFRTMTPQDTSLKVFAAIPNAGARVLDAAWDDTLENAKGPGAYRVLRGHYCTPNFQSNADDAPFLSRRGGGIAMNENGAVVPAPLPEGSRYRHPACNGMIRARFVLSIPKRPMPPAGYPLLVTAHGTGGDAMTFLGDQDFAGWAAQEGIAAISTDQPLHGGPAGGRPGAGEPLALTIAGFKLPLGNAGEVAFYNPIIPEAARGNLQQAAADAAVLVHLFGSLDLAGILASTQDRPAPRFDRTKIVAAGHSQGSQSIAALGALEPSVRGVVLSGCGGDARLGILLRKDLDIMPIIRVLLQVEEDELDAFHPFMALAQTLADPIDPESYARLYWDPLPGHQPQRVIHFAGVSDTYVPHETSEALAIALRASPLEPLVTPVGGLELLGIRAPNEAATRGYLQYRSTRRENGHFVLYHEPGASEHFRRFLKGAIGG